MKPTTCKHESRLLREARESSISTNSGDHLATCESCSTALRVDQLLMADAASVPALERMPDPALVWWRARQQERFRQTARATLPIQIAERLALALGALGLVIGLTMTWPLVRATFDRWLVGWVRGFSRVVPMDESSLILALTGSLFLLVGFGLYTQWAEQ